MRLIGLWLVLAAAYAVTLLSRAHVGAGEIAGAAGAALAFVAAALLARRAAPEPYASAVALALGLSAPALALAGSRHPTLAAGGCLAGALWLALRVRDEPRLRDAYAAALLLAAAPWADVRLVVPELPVALALLVWTARRRRPLSALIVAEVIGASLVVLTSRDHRRYGSVLQPSRAAHDALPGDAHLHLVLVFALAIFGAVLLVQAHRERLAAALPAHHSVEVAALVAVAASAGAAVLALAAGAEADATPALGLSAPLAAWGLRHAPRAGGGVCVLTIALGAWSQLN